MCACFPVEPFILDAFQRHIYVQPIRKWNPAMTSSEYNRYGDKRRWIHNTALTKSVKNCSILYLFVRRCSAGQTGLSLRRRRSGGLTVGLQGPVTLAPPGFCNRGGSEVWVHRGSRVRSPPVPVVLSVYQRGSLLDGLAMYLSCETKKFHDNESTHLLHNFWTSTHRGRKLPPFPPGGATVPWFIAVENSGGVGYSCWRQTP